MALPVSPNYPAGGPPGGNLSSSAEGRIAVGDLLVYQHYSVESREAFCKSGWTKNDSFKRLISRALSSLVGPRARESVCLEASLGKLPHSNLRRLLKTTLIPKTLFSFSPNAVQLDSLSKRRAP